MLVRHGVVLACLLVASPAFADSDDLLVDHPDARWWLSAQVNAIAQAQPGFHSPYAGANSFRSDDHTALSYVETIYAGLEVTSTTAIVVTGESAGGGGLSDALGIAGATNLDVVRNPTLGPAPYVGRAFVQQIVPLGDPAAHERDPLHVLRRLPARRIEIVAGKLSTADVFDQNAVGTDSHFQFMNWTADNNGAWDYAADTRGYTLGAVASYIDPRWAVRFGELLMPTVANGIDYDFDIAKARGENLEVELHGSPLGRPGTLRVLGFVNHAKMGSYAEAIRTAGSGAPDITASRVAGRRKIGVGINAEQELAAHVRGYGRLGWNDGDNESFAYTEVDHTVALGLDVRGDGWHRAADKLGITAISNGISRSHRDYLALGGKGFLLGDGALHYGREDIIEAYYTARVYRGVFPAIDVQVIEHPGYNTERGPVIVGSLRLHIEI